MNTNTERKKKYIQIASRILEQEGPEGINIRRIAKEAGCTSAVLYKHFDNLDHLLVLASVKFLEPYISDFIGISKRSDITSIQKDLLLWKKFIMEAFNNRTYYLQMFYGANREILEDCLYEYYSLFPDEERGFDGFGASIIFSSNLLDREFMRLRRAAHEKLITIENARLLSRLAVAVFDGMFLKSDEYTESKGGYILEAEECYRLIWELFSRFVEPGANLSIDGL